MPGSRRLGRLTVLAAVFAGLGSAACDANGGEYGSNGQALQPAVQKVETMKIRLTMGRRIQTAMLTDSAAARDFVKLLPLTLTLEDNASTDKVADLPRTLSIEGAPEGHDPSIGDITYYAPWGNLCLGTFPCVCQCQRETPCYLADSAIAVDNPCHLTLPLRVNDRSSAIEHFCFQCC